MNRRIKLFTLFVLMACTNVWAQNVSVTAKIDSVHLMIGEQAIFELQVRLGADQKAQLPLLTDTIVKGVDVIDFAPVDTVFHDGKKSMTLSQRYRITSFSPKMYLIPPIAVTVNDQEYKSSPISLKVETFPDIEQANPEEYFGAKDILTPPFVWGDWIVFFLSLLLIAPFIALLIYMVMRLLDNQPIIRRIKLEPKRLAHLEAMDELEELKSKKVWESEGAKAYYTELTDVLRNYMKSRFNFNALEMTSSEIIAELGKIKDKEEIERLKQLFETADLVKFAKFKPYQGEYDDNLTKVYEFIDRTKEVPDPDAKPEPTEEVIIEKRSLVTKLILGGVALLATAGIITCIIFIVREGGDFLRSFF